MNLYEVKYKTLKGDKVTRIIAAFDIETAIDAIKEYDKAQTSSRSFYGEITSILHCGDILIAADWLELKNRKPSAPPNLDDLPL